MVISGVRFTRLILRRSDLPRLNIPVSYATASHPTCTKVLLKSRISKVRGDGGSVKQAAQYGTKENEGLLTDNVARESFCD
jgi:hypothetical protein